MPDKMNYINKVIESCKTEEQLELSFSWGRKLLWMYYDAMDKKLDEYGSFASFTLSNMVIYMIGRLEKDITKHYDEVKYKLISNETHNK